MNTKPQLFSGLKKDGKQTKQFGTDLRDRKGLFEKKLYGYTIRVSVQMKYQAI